MLDLMAEQGYISAAEAKTAKEDEVVIRQRRENITAPHFVFWVKQLLTETYGERLVEQGGLKVITSLDFEKQQAAEEAVVAGIKKIEEKGGSNASLVAIDPHSGQILAMVGSRDYFDTEHDGAVNVALRPRQPGSSFKPIVYAAGFMKGYTPTTILYDVVTTFKTDAKNYEPKNYNLNEYGPVTIRQALAGSLNIPAVKMLYLTGVNRVLDFADQLGYTTFGDRSRFGLSLVLGGGEVKLLEHTAAFGTFASEGLRYDPAAILRVEDPQGKVLEEWRPKEGQRVFDQEVARQVTDILQDNGARSYIFGAANSLTVPGRQAAAKTGTTNNYHDAWTVGYVPSLVAGVWVGNNNNDEMGRGADGSVVAAPIWQQFMKNALADAPMEGFTAPQPVVTGKPVLDGQVGGGAVVRIDRASGMLATEYTPPEWVEERTFYEPHSILHFINKDDPRGEPPADPAADPYYNDWEAAVRRWAETNTGEITYTSPPTEYDTLHNPENRPQLVIEQPSPGTITEDNTLIVRIQVSAPRGVSKIQYIVDGVIVGERTSYPFDGGIILPEDLPKGFHILTVIASDDIENKTFIDTSFFTQ
ncbi:MAG: penicillin-binding transpeptidase domain-containing protein [bacterium]|nr:penicillin-binding transpeptidase domain-containing protein [bacterium]